MRPQLVGLDGKTPIRDWLRTWKHEEVACRVVEGSVCDTHQEQWWNGNLQEYYLMPMKVANLLKDSHLHGKPWKVLDVGSYDGNLLDFFIQNQILNFERYIGLDQDSSAIQRGEMNAGRIAKQAAKDVAFYECDTFAEQSYGDLPNDNDVIVCTGMISKQSGEELIALLKLLKSKLEAGDESRIFFHISTFDDSRQAPSGEDSMLVKESERSVGIKQHICLVRSTSSDDERIRSTTYDQQELYSLFSACGLEVDFPNSFRTPDKYRMRNNIFSLKHAG